MALNSILFYLFSSLAVVSALAVITVANPAYAVLALLVSMFSLAVLFIQLGAFFIAVVHILVYAGAILVLYLFVIMLIGFQSPKEKTKCPAIRRIFASLIALGLGSQFTLIFISHSHVVTDKKPALAGTIEAVGRILLTDYLLAFEATSILLLVGIIGAVVLARKEAVS